MARNKQSELPIGVLGAGMVGVSCALHLQSLGKPVLLIDRSEPGEGTSFGNAGVLAASSVVPVPVPGLLRKAPAMLFGRDGPLFLRWTYLPRMLPWLFNYLLASRLKTVEHISRHLAMLVTDSFEQHTALAKGTPAAKWIKPSPYLFVYREKAAFEADKLGWRLRGAAGHSGTVLEDDALYDYEPAISRDYKCGVVLENHGLVTNPGQYVKDLASTFAQRGGEVVAAEIDDIDVGNDKVVLQSASGMIETAAVVCAAGVWSERFAKKFGVTVRMESERGYHIELDGATGGPAVPVLDTVRKFVAAPMATGLRFAGLVEFGGIDAPASSAPVELLLRGARQLLPALEYDSHRSWLGHRPAPSDSLPVLGRAPGHPNVYFAYGHHHVGLTAGPKSGCLVAQLAAGREPNIDLEAFRADRAA
jgi:D-amino-acid dehydrogenase